MTGAAGGLAAERPVSDEIREYLKGRAVESASREVAVAEEKLLVARRNLATARE